MKEQNEFCDEPPARGGELGAPLEKGLSPQRLGFKTNGFRRNPWGLRQTDFEEILNDCSTNSLVLNNINSSN